MRGKGQFQIDQMRKGDARLPQLFRTLRTALDLLEDIASHPYKEAQPEPPPAQPPSILHPPETKLAYSIKEVRSLTGLSNATIYAAIKKGTLRSTKAGGRTLILALDMQAWIDSWARR